MKPKTTATHRCHDLTPLEKAIHGPSNFEGRWFRASCPVEKSHQDELAFQRMQARNRQADRQIAEIERQRDAANLAAVGIQPRRDPALERSFGESDQLNNGFYREMAEGSTHPSGTFAAAQLPSSAATKPIRSATPQGLLCFSVPCPRVALCCPDPRYVLRWMRRPAFIDSS